MKRGPWVVVAAAAACLNRQASAQVRGGFDNASWIVAGSDSAPVLADHDPYEGVDLLDVEAVVARSQATADPGDALDFVSLREMLFRAAEDDEELDTDFLRKLLRQSEANLEAVEASMESLDASSFVDEVIIDDVITDYKYVHSLYTNVSAADFESPMWENQPRLLASLDKDARAGEVLSADEALSAQDKMLIEAFAAFRAREEQMDRDLMGTAKLSQEQLRRNNQKLQDTQNGGFPVYVH